jgi:stringent starvation protein B
MTPRTPNINDEKKQTLEEALSQGLTKLIVTTSVPGVKLPAYLMSNSAVMINISRRFPYPLHLLDNGISAKLSFQGELHEIFIPWGAIGIIANCHGTGFMYPTEGGSIQGFKADSVTVDEGQPEVLVDRTVELKITPVDELQLTPPRTGHLKLVH